MKPLIALITSQGWRGTKPSDITNVVCRLLSKDRRKSSADCQSCQQVGYYQRQGGYFSGDCVLRGVKKRGLDQEDDPKSGNNCTSSELRSTTPRARSTSNTGRECWNIRGPAWKISVGDWFNPAAQAPRRDSSGQTHSRRQSRCAGPRTRDFRSTLRRRGPA